jgi:hypothetical protein
LAKALCKCTKYKRKNAVLKIYDLNGRVVYKDASTSLSMTRNGYYKRDVDVSKLSYGMYVVRLVTIEKY